MRRSLSRPSPKYSLLMQSLCADKSFKSDLNFYNSGRDALSHGLELLGIKRDSKILIPAYICDSVLAPLRKEGYSLVFFDIEEDLRLHLGRLEDLMKGLSIKAILIPHYFGFPSQIREVVSLCEKYGVQVIEDCAHSFLTKINEDSVGSFGHIAIFSMRKTLAICDGGALKFNYNMPSSRYSVQSSGISLREIVYLIQRVTEFVIVEFFRFNIYSHKFANLINRVRNIFNRIINSNDENHYKSLSNPSWMLRAYLRDKNYLNEISSARFKNFQTLIKSLKNSNIDILFKNIPSGCVPQYFILKDETGDLASKLRNSCFGVGVWPGNELPEFIRENPERFPVANKLNKTLLMLPIHQDISRDHIKAMVQVLLD